MHSPNITTENIGKLRELFPNCVAEAKDEDGKSYQAVDFDQLRQELSDYVVDGPQERYYLNWPGKREALLTANAPIAKTFRPCREESVNFDTTKNLFIEGDNLDALKLLQETYLGKVKMIYIDPPYNTGNDFVFKDDFFETSNTFLKRSNQVDEEGNRLTSNTKSNGRFHSDWLSMMYPRLKLARSLLREDGVMFISIDESEVNNLETICKEVFGHQNLLGHFPVVMNLKGNQDAFGFAETHEYFVACMRSKDSCRLYPFNVEEEEIHKLWEEDEYGLYKRADNLRATGVNAPRAKRPALYYPIFINSDTLQCYITDNDQPTSPDHEVVLPINREGQELSWYWSKQTFTQKKHNLIITQTKNGWQFYRKQRPALGELPTKKPKSFFYKPDYSTSTATIHLKQLLGEKIFDGPKPVPFILDLLQIGAKDDDIIMDFFGGSGTTAHAAMQLNALDGGNRQFIMVQLPEVIDKSFPAYGSGFSTIAQITKERIRRAGAKIVAEKHHQGWRKDVGFRVLRIDTSNMADVYYTPDAVKQESLFGAVDNIKLGRDNPEDLLFPSVARLGCGSYSSRFETISSIIRQCSLLTKNPTISLLVLMTALPKTSLKSWRDTHQCVLYFVTTDLCLIR